MATSPPGRGPDRDYRILDKDLARITNAERAAQASSRPLLRLGLAMVLVATLAEFAATALAGQPALGVMAAAVAVAIYLALSIGANDVANALGPAVGAGAIGLGAGLVTVAAMDVLGAVVAGEAVTRTLTAGLVGNKLGDGMPTAEMMLAALVAAASWISVATWLDAPVSTTHSVVGAIAGAGIATLGWDSVHWPALARIALGWVVSPLVAGGLAAALLASLHRHVLDRDDPIPGGRNWLTALVAAAAGVLALTTGLALQGPGLPAVLAASLAAAGAGALWARLMLARQIRLHTPEGVALKHLLGPPLVVAALALGFGHGANDTSNVAAPLSIILGRIGASPGPLLGPQVVLLLSGLGIAAGIVLFGGRLVRMVGGRITRLNPARALCVSMATAMTVLGFSMLGLPVSTTHLAVGGVFGVGFWREWRDRRRHRHATPLPAEEIRRRRLVRRSHLRTILTAWLITVPLNAAIAAALVLALGL